MSPTKLLIAGLGNPGPKYQHTRHNTGHLLIGELVKGPALNNNISLRKTSVYMNRSGHEIKSWLEELGITPEQLVVIHDDWAFEVGEFRLQKNRGANRHRGVLSIIDSLQTKNFWRLRIGIGPPPPNTTLRDHVLGKFNNQQLQTTQNLAEPIAQRLNYTF